MPIRRRFEDQLVGKPQKEKTPDLVGGLSGSYLFMAVRLVKLAYGNGELQTFDRWTVDTMDYEQVRTLVKTALQETQRRVIADPSYEGQMGSDMQQNTVFNRVEVLARNQGQIEATESLGRHEKSYVSQYLWELIFQGILMPVNAANTGGWPLFSFTEFGKEAILQEREYIPFDPSGYLNRLRADVGDLDGIVDFYVEESLGCFRASRYAASTVMLGVASERLFDLLQDVFMESLVSEKERTQLRARVDGRMIVHRYDELKKRIEPKKPQLPTELRDKIETNLVSIFNLIRYSRNDNGHPSSRVVEREEAYANLYTFGGYCKYMYQLINHLNNNPKSLA